jgi:hypothetical protein
MSNSKADCSGFVIDESALGTIQEESDCLIGMIDGEEGVDE